MESLFNLCDLILKGGIYYGVKGNTAPEVYENISKLIKLPDCCSAEEIASELSAREKVLSTAVGNGVAIPHPKRPLLEKAEDHRIIVCFPENELDMGAPDKRKVFVMFIILSETTQFHLKALSALAKVIKHEDVQQLLRTKPSESDLLQAIKEKI